MELVWCDNLIHLQVIHVYMTTWCIPINVPYVHKTTESFALWTNADASFKDQFQMQYDLYSG